MRRLLPCGLIGLLLFSGCAPLFQKPKVRVPQRSVPETPSLPRSRAPERGASYDLLSKGNNALAEGKFETAIDLFQESINLDPTNGVAYYYLAVAKSRVTEEEETDTGEILDLLDRAEGLLEGEPSWKKSIERFREEILTSPARP